MNEVLSEDLCSGRLHSVRMKCMTQAQWNRKGKPQAFNAVCAAKPCTAGTYSPVSVVAMEPPKSMATLEEAALRLPPAAAPSKGSPFVCEGGCGLAR